MSIYDKKSYRGMVLTLKPWCFQNSFLKRFAPKSFDLYSPVMFIGFPNYPGDTGADPRFLVRGVIFSKGVGFYNFT